MAQAEIVKSEPESKPIEIISTAAKAIKPKVKRLTEEEMMKVQEVALVCKNNAMLSMVWNTNEEHLEEIIIAEQGITLRDYLLGIKSDLELQNAAG